MISQLLATIMMALGVASGTEATSNTFYDAEKPQTKQAVVNYDEDILFALGGEWHNQGYVNEYKKYYLTNNAQLTPTSTLILSNMIIYNSTYTFEKPIDSQAYELQTIGIYKIQNIYNGTSQFELEELLNLNANIYYGRYLNVLSTDTNLDQALDITMTEGSYTTITNIINNIQNATTLNSGNLQYGNTHVETILNQTTTITLDENEIKYLVMITNLRIPNVGNNSGDIILENLNITGQYQAPNYTYEIVDLPGVMFTVLSMPFSFISTAFNLTIFPNTQYQLNFANLFMVILAAFILMWLIKKVFH